MQEIQTSGKSLLKLVNELIAVAQTEAGAVAFAESHVDVVSLAATTMASVASEAGRKGILLQNLIEDGAPRDLGRSTGNGPGAWRHSG